MLRSIAAADDPDPISRTSAFTFAWLRSILDAARTGAPWTLERDGVVAVPVP